MLKFAKSCKVDKYYSKYINGILKSILNLVTSSGYKFKQINTRLSSKKNENIWLQKYSWRAGHNVIWGTRQ